VKNRHNKKRNTALVFESLVREATVAIMKGDVERKDTVLKIVKKHFKPGTALRKNLDCYKSLYENQDIPTAIGEKVLNEAKIASRLVDPDGLFKQQSELINDVNKQLSSSVFNNFVPNYKTLATIAQIFSSKLTPINRVMLEKTIVDNMASTEEETPLPATIGNLALTSFTKKFNDKYSTVLKEEQKELLSYYITSFADNAVELKTFLNEEIQRLKDTVRTSAEENDFANDTEMIEKAAKIVEKLECFKNTEFDDSILITILKTQDLVRELVHGDNN
jgi:hypothetical protein